MLKTPGKKGKSSSQNLEENLVMSNGNEDSSDSQMDLKSALLSWKFMLMYMITLCKSGVNLYYGNEAKFLSLKMVENDGFITSVLMCGVIINLVTRLNMGALEAYLGIGKLYCLNILLNMATSILPFFYQKSKFGVIGFIFLQRLSNGKNIYFVAREEKLSILFYIVRYGRVSKEPILLVRNGPLWVMILILRILVN